MCMCASMGMLGMGEFRYDLGFTKMCGTCKMQLAPRGMGGMMMDCVSFLLSFLEGAMAPK